MARTAFEHETDREQFRTSIKNEEKIQEETSQS